MRTYRIAAIPGDGIGTEVIPAGIEVLKGLSSREQFGIEFTSFDWSSERYVRTGTYIPQGGLDELKKFDAIFFGAVGAPDVPDHVSLWGLRLPICQGFDQYANVRPSRVLPGIKSPLEGGKDIDWVIVRENTEGEYSGAGEERDCRSSSSNQCGGKAGKLAKAPRFPGAARTELACSTSIGAVRA